VRVVGRRVFQKAVRRHPDLERALDTWHRTAKAARWENIADVRQTYPHADAVGDFTVFNVRGNNYRLIARIDYEAGLVVVRHVFTHKEYSDWGK